MSDITSGQDVDITSSVPIPVTDNSGSLTVDAVSLPLPTGAATSALQTQPGVDIGDVTINNAAGASAVNVQDGGNALTVDSLQLPAALVGGRLDNNIGSWFGSTSPTIAQKVMNLSIPVVIASNQTVIPVSDNGGSLTIDDGFSSITVDNAGGFAVTDGGGLLSIDDGAGSITVDGTVNATVSGTVTAVDGGFSLTVDNVGGFGVTTTADTTIGATAPATGFQITAQDGVGTAHALSVNASDLSLNVRAINAVGSAAVNIQDGGNSITVDSGVGVLSVNNTGSFTVQDSQKIVDNNSFSDGGTYLDPVGYVFDEVAGTALSENDLGAARIDAKRAQITTLEDATTRGQRAAVSAAGRLSVDASGVAVPVTDNAGSLTIDAPVGTPVAARLSDGAAFYDATKTGQLPAALVGARLDTNNGAWLGSTAPTVGAKTTANSIPVALASDQTVIPVNGDVDHDAVNTLKNIQIAGNASPADVGPAVVSANGDRVRAWFDRSGARIVRPRKIRLAYTAVFRLAEAAARLDQTFLQVANTNKQWATLHHTGGSTKEVRLLKCSVFITAWDAATQGVLELRQISSAPATGNPAITPTLHRRGGTAAEAVALYLPTTAGTDVAPNSPIASVALDLGVMGAVDTQNPMTTPREIVLFNAADEDPEMIPPSLPVATLDGWAVMLRTVGTPNVRMTVVMRFTEEIP